MSNQCSNLLNYRSFSPFTPFHPPLKPYANSLRLIFPFHSNLILTGRTSRNRRSPLHPPVSAQSSSDILLIATTKHNDGSLVFRFGDASEVVKLDEVVEEIESKTELESNVLNGDQERQVIVKTIEKGYGSDGEEVNEVADEIANEVDSNVAEKETNVISDLRDYNEESSERLSDITEEEVLSSQSDAIVNGSVEGVEITFDKTESIAQLDEDESLSASISLLDTSVNKDNSADPEGMLLKDSDDETEDPSVSVKLESVEDSDIEVMDAKQPYAEDDLQNVETENAASDVELMSAANDVEEELQEINMNEGSLIDEMPLYDSLEAEPTLDAVSELRSVQVKAEATMEISSTETADVKNWDMEDELQQVSTNNEDENDVAYLIPFSSAEEAEQILEEEVSQPQSNSVELNPTLQVSDDELEETMDQNVDDGVLQVIDEIEDSSASVEPPSDVLGAELTLDEASELQSSDVKFEAAMEVSTTKDMEVKEQPIENELEQVSTDNKDDNGVAYVKHDSPIAEAEAVLEKEVSQPLQLLDINLEDTIGQNLDDGNLQAIDETEIPSISVKLETMQDSDIEVTDVTQPYAEDELSKVETEETSKSDTEDFTPSSSPVNIEQTLDEVSQPQPTHVNLEEAMEVSNTDQDMDVKDLQTVEDDMPQVSTDNSDVAYEMPGESYLKEEVSQPQSTHVELIPIMQVSDVEVEDTTGQNVNDGILQVIDEDAGDTSVKYVEESSHLLEAQPVQDETDALGSSILLEQGVDGSLVKAESIEVSVSSSEVDEASQDSALLLDDEAKVESREEINLTSYFLTSGAALLEQPFKALTGGDDAYFVANSKWLGVASGVSQWSFEGTDPGVYARELMRTCEDIVLDASNESMNNPVELLCRGVKETNMSGSSNVLIANFDGQALHVANIGDTGFMIIRHGAIYKKSSPLLHEFHFALQVKDCDDPLQLVEEHIIEVEEEDIVVSATDGLFDNLYEREIAMIVSKSLQTGMEPQETANVLAMRAHEVGRSAFVRSPFSDAAQAAGYTGYSGGKPDNVAVVVSLVGKAPTF